MTVTEAPPEGMTISAAAEASGLSVDTLRYYEKEGLTLHRPGRSSSGQRRYTQENVAWLGTLVMLRRTGMPIRDVRRYADLVRTGSGNEAERLDLLKAHRERVEAQLAEVGAHLRAIDHKIGIYEGTLEQAS